MSSHDLVQTITPYVKPPRRPPAPRTITANIRCGCQCPGGNGCTLDSAPTHTLHICATPTCACPTNSTPN